MSEVPLAFQLFNEIGIIDQLAGTAFERALPQGMPRAQFSVLNHFVRLDLAEQSPARLASAFQVTRPTMTSTLARMERAGLVEIRPDPNDGRGKRVSITPAGREMRERCIAAVAGLLPLASAVLDDARMGELVAGLRQLRIALDRARTV